MSTNDNHSAAAGQSRWRIGAVSYLNARPLIHGLDRDSMVRLQFDVPSRLSQRLAAGEFDAALIPVIDVLERKEHLQIVGDACIGCDGETLTVRLFSNVPTADVREIHLDRDSHTSAALVKLLWPALYSRQVPFADLEDYRKLGEHQAALLIGDKVVGVPTEQFRYQVDLGGAWKTWTGLPFVFAVWAAPRGRDIRDLSRRLGQARDRGMAKAGQIAVEFGPRHGWPVPLAQQYLQRYLSFAMTDQHVEGMMRFYDLLTTRGLLPGAAELQSA